MSTTQTALMIKLNKLNAGQSATLEGAEIRTARSLVVKGYVRIRGTHYNESFQLTGLGRTIARNI